MAARGMTDGDEVSKAETMAARILEFVEQAEIEDTLDAGEKALLRQPAGSWSQLERNQASWLVEGVAVLAWTLCRAELPAYGTKCQAAPVSLSLGLFRPEVREQIGEWETRGQEEIAVWAARYFALHFRLHHYFAQAQKMDFAEVLRDPKWPHSVRDGLELVDGDLAIDGKALAEVGPERLGEVFSIVRERCKAFRWLTGYDKSYATVTRVQ
jgi:hypothetical protein